MPNPAGSDPYDFFGISDIPSVIGATPYRPEAYRHLQGLALEPTPRLLETAQRVVGAIDGFTQRHGWLPWGRLRDAGYVIANFLIIADRGVLANLIWHENDGMREMGANVAAGRQQRLERIERLGNPSLSQQVMANEPEPDVPSLARTVFFRVLAHVALAAAGERVKTPNLDGPEDMQRLRGIGIAAEISIHTPLSDRALEWLCEWDDELERLHDLCDDPREVWSSLFMTMHASADEEELMAEFAAATPNLLGTAERVRPQALLTALALRMHQRRYPEDSPLEDVFERLL